MVAGPFQGDWWHAARIYRQWWVKQPWAGQGLLIQRPDIPQWLKQASLALRPSTSNPARTLAANLKTITSVGDAFPQQSLFGVWYGWTRPPWPMKSLDDGGNGHVFPPQPGLSEALAALRGRDVHLQAYVQSMIYDARLQDADAAAALTAVTRDLGGKAVPYGTGKDPHLLAMCRAAPWWQRVARSAATPSARRASPASTWIVSARGAPECFAPDHHHPPGGGRTVLASQRDMAQRIPRAIREKNPEAIMSGEDPVEAFRDLLDVHLYSVNVMAHYRPISRVVWGDYSLGHGRVLGLTPSVDTLIGETAMLFVEGTIPGRLYCDAQWVLLQPQHARELEFLQHLAAYTRHSLDYLRSASICIRWCWRRSRRWSPLPIRWRSSAWKWRPWSTASPAAIATAAWRSRW